MRQGPCSRLFSPVRPRRGVAILQRNLLKYFDGSRATSRSGWATKHGVVPYSAVCLGQLRPGRETLRSMGPTCSSKKNAIFVELRGTSW
jgi:hypothetical protein